MSGMLMTVAAAVTVAIATLSASGAAASRIAPSRTGESGVSGSSVSGSSVAGSIVSGSVASPLVGKVSGRAGYTAPLTGPMRVVRPFEAPPTPYSAGHRGVDLASATEVSVLAAADGTVTFAGQVAGRGVVVILHADGVRTEYEPITPTVRRSEIVSRGQPIGRVFGRHGDCLIGSCLHWSARRGNTYFDPLALLRDLGVVHLVPLTDH